MAKPKPHPLVDALAKALKPPAVDASISADTPDALVHASDLPEVVALVGFLGGSVTDAHKRVWRVLYLDWLLSNWLFVEEDGIVESLEITDDSVPFKKCDVIWVKEDAAVGRGSRSLSVEAQFLTGDFTRAGDYEASPTDGPLAATRATPFGCRRRSQS